MADTDTIANPIYTSLVGGLDLTTPAVDLTASEFAVPADDGTGVYNTITRLTQEELTTGDVNGTGMFDGLMRSLSAHLNVEHKAGRISGKEYSQAYIAMTQQAMGTAVQYLLNRDQSYWTSQLVQQQAQAAQAEAVRARVAIAIAREQLKSSEIEKQVQAVSYANGKQRLALGEAEYDLTIKQQAKADIEIASLLPAEASRIQAQTSQITAQKDKTLQETSSIIPAQASNIAADTKVKDYQHLTLMPAQKEKLVAEELSIIYDKDILKPAQLTSINEQTNAHRAKTLDTRMDALPVAGAIGKQKELHSQQIISYERDVEAKIAKLFLDTYITTKTVDPDTLTPAELTSSNISAVIANLRTNSGM